MVVFHCRRNSCLPILYVICLCILFFFACTSPQGNKNVRVEGAKVVKANGFIVPKDSVQAPQVMILDEKKLKRSNGGKTVIVPMHNNKYPAGTPLVVKAGDPIVNKIGEDTFAIAKKTKAVYDIVTCKMPKPVKAAQPVIKDNASINIQYLDVEQGLSSSYVSCFFENDSPLQNGIWFGSDGGGVSHYDGEHFTHFNTESGLSSNSVVCILQDEKEALWFGTFAGGIVQYDGNVFKIFEQENDLGDNTILCMLKDHQGNIWFGRDGGGVSKYEQGNETSGDETFTTYNTSTGLNSNTIRCMFQDKDQNIWFGTDDGVCKYSDDVFYLYNKKNGFIGESVVSIIQDQQGVLWFATDAGLIAFDGDTFRTFTSKQGLNEHPMSTLLNDNKGNIWIGTQGGGISKYDGKTFTHYTEKEGLSNNKITGIVQLKNGDLWIGTFGAGINIFDISEGGFTHFTQSNGLSNSMISSIIQDRQGNFWFATYGNGISKLDTSTKTFIHYNDKDAAVSSGARTMIQDRAGNIWVGTDGEGVVKIQQSPVNTPKKLFTRFTAESGLGDNTIWDVYEDQKGNLWFGTFAGVCKFDGKSFTQYNESSGLSNNTVMCITEDRSGNFWFGTFGGGITQFEPQTNVFTHFNTNNGLSSNTVMSIVEDVSGNLWMGTDGGGVCKYDGTHFTHYTTNEGLSSNTVWSILEDTLGGEKEERFWFGTEKGLTYFSQPKVTVKNPGDANTSTKPSCILFTKNEGLLANDFVLNSAMIDHEGKAWWGTGKSLTRFDIKNYQIPDEVPVIQLNDISINETYIDYRSLKDTANENMYPATFQDIEFNEVAPFNNYGLKLKLPYDLDHLTFNFSALDQAGQSKIRYQFMIEGLDKKWNELTKQNQADYRNLPHGSFVFKVKALGISGKWSTTFEYPFTIHPPWWKSIAAKIGYVLLGIILVFGIVRWNSRRLIRRAEFLEEEIDKATIEIKAEKKKSDDLLLNILPEEVAEELKKTGEAEAKQFNEVTVLFTDFVGFTTISEQMNATDLVAEIHKNFTAFDAIIEQYGLEKIKTIGDAYMAVCGLPHASADHALRVVKAALAIRDYIAKSGGKFQIRIGINSGSVVAGIVGVKKYAYDIWGDTVNTASRIESTGEPGKVNISGSTYHMVKDLFNCTYRGKINVKGKGEIDMYFVE